MHETNINHVGWFPGTTQISERPKTRMNGRWKISYKCPLIWLQVFLSHECIRKLDTCDIDRSCKNCQFVIGQNNSKFSNIIFEQANMSLVSVGIVRKAHRSEIINVIAAETNQTKGQIFLVRNFSLISLYFCLSWANLIVLFQFICRFGARVPTSQLLPLTDPFVFKTCKELITE